MCHQFGMIPVGRIIPNDQSTNINTNKATEILIRIVNARAMWLVLPFVSSLLSMNNPAAAKLTKIPRNAMPMIIFINPIMVRFVLAVNPI
ncbi:MAG: hypothetical protein RL541_863 [Pseudomonadota bacterium]